MDDTTILIDMSPLKAGGGCQLAINFLTTMSMREDSSSYVFLVPDTGPVAEASGRFPKLRFVVSPTSSPIRRLLFESLWLRNILRRASVRTIYTFFGPGLPHDSRITSIVSVAYPIICYPDSSYWEYAPRRIAARQRVVNWARVRRLRQADLIVAETRVMRERLSRTLSLPLEQIAVRAPAPSAFVHPRAKEFSWGGRVSFLVLSGNALHKNTWRIPELASELGDLGTHVKWQLSMTFEQFTEALSPPWARWVEEHIHSFDFLGPVPPEEVQTCYERADALISLSDLESFSNNYLEAWKTGTPIFASDRDFSRAILQDSAVFFEPHNARASAETISYALNSPELAHRLVSAGHARLSTYSDPEERAQSIIDLIESSKSR